MAVGVVPADGDDGDPGTAGREEARVVVRAPVVRHLQHVGPQVHAPTQQPLLCLFTEVPGEQDPHAVHRHPGDDGQVVGLGATGGDLGRRCQHLDGGRPHLALVAGHQYLLSRPRAADRPAQRGATVVGGRERSRGHHPDLPVAERAGQAADVVGVQVGEQHQRQPVDAQPVQTAVHRDHVGSCVDQHGLPRTRGHHEGVPLADVAGHEDGVGGPPPAGHLPQRPPEQHDADDQRQGRRAQPGPAPEGEHHGHDHAGEDEGTRRPSGPPGDRVG